MKNEQQQKKIKPQKSKKKNNKESKYLIVSKDVDINQKTYRYIKEINNKLNIDLNKVALCDGEKSFSYGQMYEEWDKYAKVFTSLNITKENKSRVLMFGSMALETSLAIFGLNIVGAEISIIPSVSLLNFDKVIQTIKSENISDIIISDTLLREEVLKSLIKQKEEFNLKNIILMNISTSSYAVPKLISMFFDKKANLFKLKYKDLYLHNLIKKYEDEKPYVDENISRDSSFILHTSGTTSGCGKPVPHSDKSTNAKCRSILMTEEYEFLKEDVVTSITVDLSNGYSFSNQLNVFLSLGAKIIFVPFGVLNPFLASAVDKYKFTTLFTVGPALEGWAKMPGNSKYDFSSLKAIVVGGSPFSQKDRNNCEEFFKTIKGENIKIINGYGLTELGGACSLSLPEDKDESIGYVMPGVKIKLMDEDTNKFISNDSYPKTGVLYINSDAATNGVLDNKTVVEFENIDNEKYLCTNDVVEISKDGRLRYVCRANRFFINKGTISYNANKVESQIRKSGLQNRAVVISEYDKNLHDTLPMLCVESTNDETQTLEDIKKVLLKSFGPRKLKLDQLPKKIFITKEFIKNTNGKIDLFKLKMGQVQGKKYDIESVKENNKLIDINFKPIEENNNYLYDYTKQIVDDLIGGLIADFIPKSWLSQKNIPWLELASLLGDSETNEEFKQKIQEFIFKNVDIFNDQFTKLNDISQKIKNNEFDIAYAQYLNLQASKMVKYYYDNYSYYQKMMYNYYKELNNMFSIFNMFNSLSNKK